MSWPAVKRAGLIVLFVLFTIGGLAIAVFGEGSDRLLGLATVLIFGGGGAALWFMNRPNRRLHGLQAGTIPAPGGREPVFIARSDPVVLRVAALGCIAMGAGTLMFAVPGGSDADVVERLLLGAGGVFLVGIGLFSAYRSANSPKLVLARSGIRATGPAGWFVPWEAVAGIGELVVHENPFLAIRVTDPAAIEMSGAQQLLHAAERSIMGTDLSFPLRTLTVDPAELNAAIERYLEQPEERAGIGRPDELALVRGEIPAEPTTPPTSEPRRRRPLAGALAIGSLFIVGGLLLLVCLAALSEEPEPGSEGARLLGIALVAALASVQVAAAILLVRRQVVGRWLAIGSVIGLLVLALLGLVRSESDGRAFGLVLTAILLAELAVVVVGGRVTDPVKEQPSAAHGRG